MAKKVTFNDKVDLQIWASIPNTNKITAQDMNEIGDKITYNGKKYICKLDNCVWTPDAYPAGWEEVVEETTESEG